MAITYKILGQVNPSANTLTTIYTTPAATQTVVSTITICNLGNVASQFSLAVRPAGASIANSMYINYQTVIPGNDTIAVSIGLTLGNTDVLSCNVLTSTIALSAFGAENT